MFSTTGKRFDIRPANGDNSHVLVVCPGCLITGGWSETSHHMKCQGGLMTLSRHDLYALLAVRAGETPLKSFDASNCHDVSVQLGSQRKFVLHPTVEDRSAVLLACVGCLRDVNCTCNCAKMLISQRDLKALLDRRVEVTVGAGAVLAVACVGCLETTTTCRCSQRDPKVLLDARIKAASAAFAAAPFVQGAISDKSESKMALNQATTNALARPADAAALKTHVENVGSSAACAASPGAKKLPELASTLVKALRDSREINDALKRELELARADGSRHAVTVSASRDVEAALRAELEESRKAADALRDELSAETARTLGVRRLADDARAALKDCRERTDVSLRANESSLEEARAALRDSQASLVEVRATLGEAQAALVSSRAETTEAQTRVEELLREQAELKGMLSEGWALVDDGSAFENVTSL